MKAGKPEAETAEQKALRERAERIVELEVASLRARIAELEAKLAALKGEGKA